MLIKLENLNNHKTKEFVMQTKYVTFNKSNLKSQIFKLNTV